MKNKLILGLLSAAFVFNAAEAKIGLNVRAGGGYARNSFQQNGVQDQDTKKNYQRIVEKVGLKDDKDGKKKAAALEGYKDYDLKDVDLNTATVESAIDVEYELANDWFVGGTIGMSYLFEAKKSGGVKLLNWDNIISYTTIAYSGNFNADVQKFIAPFNAKAGDNKSENNELKKLELVLNDACVKKIVAQEKIHKERLEAFDENDNRYKTIKTQNDKEVAGLQKSIQAPYTISAQGPMYMIGLFAGKNVGKISYIAGLNLTMRSLEIKSSFKVKEYAVKHDTKIALGIMPMLRVNYAFHERVGVYAQVGYNISLSGEEKLDINVIALDTDASLLQPVHSKMQVGNVFIASAGVVAKVY